MNDLQVIAAGKAALESHGAGLSSVRFICGTQDIHKKLEAQIAKVKLSYSAYYNSHSIVSVGVRNVELVTN